jgi:hypothetical protein
MMVVFFTMASLSSAEPMDKGEIPFASKFFSPETGELYWDLDNQYRIEYKLICHIYGWSLRSNEDLTSETNCKSTIIALNKYREDLKLPNNVILDMGEDPVSESFPNEIDYPGYEDFQGVYKQIKSGGPVIATINNLTEYSDKGYIKSIIDISDLEQAKTIQLKFAKIKYEKERQHQLRIQDEEREIKNQEKTKELILLTIVMGATSILIGFTLWTLWLFRKRIKSTLIILFLKLKNILNKASGL